MKNSLKYRLLSLMAFALILLLAAPAFSGDVRYAVVSPTTQDIQQASFGEFKFTATSPVLPETGRNKKAPYDAGCVLADFIAKDLLFTDPITEETSPFDFSTWFSIGPQSYCYAGPNVIGPEVTVQVDIPAGASVGTYTAKLVAKAPLGIGWGEAAGVHITINVVQATSCDTTAPIVTVNKPTEGQDFTLGKRVELDFSATDPESPIISWEVALNSNPITLLSPVVTSILNGINVDGYILTGLSGTTITRIGNYTLSAFATNDGGGSGCDDVTGYMDRHFNINYEMNPIAPQMTADPLICDKSTKKCGSPRDLQIKFDAMVFSPNDTETTISGTERFVRDETVRVQVVRDSDSAVMIDRTYSSSGNVQTVVTISGSTGNLAGQYFTKVIYDIWKTWDNGSYTIGIYFHDYAGNDFLQYQKGFTVQD